MATLSPQSPHILQNHMHQLSQHRQKRARSVSVTLIPKTIISTAYVALGTNSTNGATEKIKVEFTNLEDMIVANQFKCSKCSQFIIDGKIVNSKRASLICNDCYLDECNTRDESDFLDIPLEILLQLNQLQVYCVNQQDGCEHVCAIGSLADHLSHCTFRPTKGAHDRGRSRNGRRLLEY